MGSRNGPTSRVDNFMGPGRATDESMRLNCSMSNRGFIDGMQAVIILRFIEALYKRQLNEPCKWQGQHTVPRLLNPQ